MFGFLELELVASGKTPVMENEHAKNWGFFFIADR